MTTIDSLKQHAPDILQTPAFQEDPKLLQQLQAAMKYYAEQKAKSFAVHSICNVLESKDIDWAAYIAEHPLE